MKIPVVKRSVIVLVLAITVPVFAGNGNNKNECTTIQEGILTDSDGNLLEIGFDSWGYNYQGRMFKGGYCDAYRDAVWCQAWKEDYLLMKWNDAWLSNADCDFDGDLDRHFGFETYRDSGAWLTNHQSGEYPGANGKVCKWTYFVKIVAAPADAEVVGDIWIMADGTELGPEIWGDFAIILEVYNDPCGVDHGVQYVSPVGPGLGKF